MKIAIIGSKGLPAKYGGVQTVVQETAPIMVSLGHKVTVFGRYYYTQKKRCVYKGVKVRNVRGIKTKRLDTITHVLLSTIQATFGDFDVIVFHSHVSGFLSVIPKMFGKKTVLHVHGILSAHKHYGKWNVIDTFAVKFLILLTRWALDKIITVSLSQKELTEKIYNREVEVIPNGIKISEKLVEKENEKYFLFVGRIINGKGLETLISAFLKYLKSYPCTILKIVGSPVNTQNYLKKLKIMSGDSGAIQFCGNKTGYELLKLYNNAFCVVIPSEKESFGLVLLEALSRNGVVIASDLEQFKIMADGFISFFETNNYNSLFEQMKKLTVDHKYYNYLSEKSLTFSFDSYDWSNITNSYLTLYYSVLLK
ncbi:MAG: hypothetical protein SRB1_02011 [Desulfobacteraceae bacterium Eth-SRB1]|nr:MAG: hypothetical protein SRB1_02011 [Desulfobacteraceae bacterium Eth-SRB1]